MTYKTAGHKTSFMRWIGVLVILLSNTISSCIATNPDIPLVSDFVGEAHKTRVHADAPNQYCLAIGPHFSNSVAISKETGIAQLRTHIGKGMHRVTVQELDIGTMDNCFGVMFQGSNQTLVLAETGNQILLNRIGILVESNDIWTSPKTVTTNIYNITNNFQFEYGSCLDKSSGGGGGEGNDQCNTSHMCVVHLRKPLGNDVYTHIVLEFVIKADSLLEVPSVVQHKEVATWDGIAKSSVGHVQLFPGLADTLSCGTVWVQVQECLEPSIPCSNKLWYRKINFDDNQVPWVSTTMLSSEEPQVTMYESFSPLVPAASDYVRLVDTGTITNQNALTHREFNVTSRVSRNRAVFSETLVTETLRLKLPTQFYSNLTTLGKFLPSSQTYFHPYLVYSIQFTLPPRGVLVFARADCPLFPSTTDVGECAPLNGTRIATYPVNVDGQSNFVQVMKDGEDALLVSYVNEENKVQVRLIDLDNIDQAMMADSSSPPEDPLAWLTLEVIIVFAVATGAVAAVGTYLCLQHNVARKLLWRCCGTPSSSTQNDLGQSREKYDVGSFISDRSISLPSLSQTETSTDTIL